VTPIPIRRLLLLFRLSKGTILFVPLAEVLTVGTVFVVIPIVVVLVGAIIDPVAVFIVSMVFFLASIVLRLGRSTDCRRGHKGCSKKKGTEKISITTVHIVFLLAQEFLRGVFSCGEYAVIAMEAMSHTEHRIDELGLLPASSSPSLTLRHGVNILVAFPLREYRAVDRSADAKRELQFTVL
jgi:hypothetical protein